MQSRFFLPGIAPDIARITQALAVRFLEPLVQFILVLVEPVTAKDIAPRKRSRGRFPAVLQDRVVGKVDDDIPVPGGGECIGKVQHPRRARDLIALAQELNRGGTKGGPMARLLRIPTGSHSGSPTNSSTSRPDGKSLLLRPKTTGRSVKKGLKGQVRRTAQPGAERGEPGVSLR